MRTGAIARFSPIMDSIIKFANNGGLVIGICNGFQTLVNLGLLPGFEPSSDTRSVALVFNDCGNFRNDWVHLKINSQSPCVFTRGLELLELPVRHGEGKFYADDAILERLFENNQVAIQYALPDGIPAAGAFPHNPNGSIRDIAGVCDASGRIFGLMPHPEAYNHWTNHPDWMRQKERLKRQGKDFPDDLTPGLKILKNAVDYIQKQ